MGSALETIILAASVLYELVGPVCAKLSLYLSGSYSTKLEEIVQVEEKTDEGEQKSSLEILIERIQKIQQELPKNTVVYEIQGPMFFADADKFLDFTLEEDTRTVILRMGGVPTIDATCMKNLELLLLTKKLKKMFLYLL